MVNGAARGGLFRLLAVLSLAVLLGTCFFDVVYLPQQQTLTAERVAIDDIRQQVDGLHRRVGSVVERERNDAAHELLRERITRIEEILRRIDPSASAHLGDPLVLPSAPLATKTPAAPAPLPGSPVLVSTTNGLLQGTKEPAGVDKKKAEPRNNFRHDHKCGPNGELPNGQTAGCDPKGVFPCCSVSGWCGSTAAHCSCRGCIDYRKGSQPSGALGLSPEQLPYNESAPKSIALVVPFRDRGTHLEKFRQRIQLLIEAWNVRGIRHKWMVFVVEQFDNELFNRGGLFNIGFEYAMAYEKRTGTPFDCVVMHDIDILPTITVDYGWCLLPIQLSGEIECWDWSTPYADNVGGVVSLSPADWKKINGFSNQYQGWGGEDDDLYLRLKQNDLLKGNCHTFCNDKPKVKMVYRPPLGKGRFTCLDDGDHTPRQRSKDDQALWARLTSMKSNSQRWLDDGLSTVNVHSIGEPLESAACDTECEAPEDPTPRQRSFGEHWSRVSTSQIPDPNRVEVIMPPGHGCDGINLSRSLTIVPLGLAHLRRLLFDLFGGACGVGDDWVQKADFVLIDVTLGQELHVGSGVPTVIADSAVPTLASDKQAAPQERDNEFMVQGQRLSRWMRRLPKEHRGWAVITQEPLPTLRERLIAAGLRHVQTAPACISAASFRKDKQKYRVTLGTMWCGFGGWTSIDNFQVLRSRTSVAEDELVPICISYNQKEYTYRFERSEAGCHGIHSGSQVDWTHAGTFYTTKSATGETICVGLNNEAGGIRWMMKKTSRCDESGFVHQFSFRAMSTESRSPFVQCCLLSAEVGDFIAQRLGCGTFCGSVPDQRQKRKGAQGLRWRRVQDIMLLASPQKKNARRLCLAESVPPDSGPKTEPEAWRLFEGDVCDGSTATTSIPLGEGVEDLKMPWSIMENPRIWLPVEEPDRDRDGAGSRFCLCRRGSGGSSTPSIPYGALYTLVAEIECKSRGLKVELCIRGLTASEVVRLASLIDEPS